MKKKKAIQKKSKRKSTKTNQVKSSPTWVEKIAWQPVIASLQQPTIDSDTSASFAVVSWNILAEAYANRRSHPHLPLSYQSVVFDRPKRRLLLQQTLNRLSTSCSVDIFCLQEVDLQEHVTHYLQKALGYQSCQTPTNKAGGGVSGRVDACAIFFSTQQFEWLDKINFPPQVVHLDDIASLGATKTNTSSSSLACSGLSSSFLRHNMALIVALRHKSTEKPVVVVNTHLYWHPGFEYVKLCQMHYVLQRATAFAAKVSSAASPSNNQDVMLPAIIICGDLNSLPKSSVHQYVTQGKVNAKRAAPWHYFWNPVAVDDDKDGIDEDKLIDTDESAAHNYTEDDRFSDIELDSVEEDETVHSKPVHQEGENETEDISEFRDYAGKNVNGERGDGSDEEDFITSLNDKLGDIELEPSPSTTAISNFQAFESSYSTEKVRYLVDYTLNRLCRWLRILGIDAAIETEEEEQLRTKAGNLSILFDRCRKECRALVTTSTKLVVRNSCPPGTFLISPQVPNLELALAQLLLLHGVSLEPSNFLSRCVVCNGNIRAVSETEEKRRVLAGHQAPEELSLELEVYECNGCGQGYWWCERPTSSASRVKNQATRLLEVCVRAGVPIKGELGLFDCVDVKALREEGWDGPVPLEQLEVIEWLKNERLSHSLQLRSAYASAGDSTVFGDKNAACESGGDRSGGELLQFTNVTHGFVGTLDHILFDHRCLTQTDRLYVPTTFAELNEPKVRNGHCLPSNVWPSDHLAIGARLAFRNTFPRESDCHGMDEKQVIIDAITRDVEPSSDPAPAQPSAPSSLIYCPPALEGAADGVMSPEPSAPHVSSCACGCVPKIRSLFEMAELRRQAKLDKQTRQSEG